MPTWSVHGVQMSRDPRAAGSQPCSPLPPRPLRCAGLHLPSLPPPHPPLPDPRCHGSTARGPPWPSAWRPASPRHGSTGPWLRSASSEVLGLAPHALRAQRRGRAVPCPRASPWQVLSSPVQQKLLLLSTHPSGISPTAGCAPCAPAALQSHPRHRKGWDKPVGQPGGLGMETGATHGAGTHRRRPRGSHTNPPSPKPGSWFPPCVGDQAWACVPLGRRPSADGTCPRPWDPLQGPLPQSVPWQACVQTDLPFPRALDTHTAHEECTLGQKPAQGSIS